VNSHFRLGVSPTPLVFERAEGPFLYDIDGNQLIDYYLGMGPMILGHSPTAIVEAVQSQLRRGILFGGQSEIEFEAAELVCSLVPCAERVRFGTSGSEMVQAGIRVARAATGRDTVIKFEGHYHGWFDNILWSVTPPSESMGDEKAPVPLPGTLGQDELAGRHTEVLSWNNIDLIEERLERRDVAAVLMEPAMCNAGAIPPLPGYLEAVRETCRRTGTVLIFDEVITGFRVASGGAQQRLAVIPDLAIFAKAIANGFPVACLAGSAALMDLFGTGRVVHAGTYNSQAIAMAGTVATLKALAKAGVYEKLEWHGTRLMDGIRAAFRDAGIEATVTGFPQIFHVGLGLSEPPHNYRDTLALDRKGYVRFTTALLQRGVRALERGAWFISTEHEDSVVDATIDAVRQSLVTL
jgi:glutamate-1-semialdehyde 2,1-aminomutase